MPKKIKLFISFFFIFIFSLSFQHSFAKYVIEDTVLAVKLDIDRCKPNIELLDITTSNPIYPNYANKTHIISGHIKLIEKNIIRNNLSTTNLKIKVANEWITPNFQNFSLVSDTPTEKIYAFSFTNTASDGALTIVIPSGIVEDKSGLLNDAKYFSTHITIDNIAPVATFKEISNSNHKSKAEITANESICPISGWDSSNNNTILSKEFTNYITYGLPITDFAQNHSEVLIDIKNATYLSLQYGTFDDYSSQTVVSAGKVSAPNTITSNSICKSEVILINLSGNISSDLLQGRVYDYTHWGDGARDICRYSEMSYIHGYNDWVTVGKNKLMYFNKILFTQMGGRGQNFPNATSANIKIPIPSDIAKQYLYGISGIQFKLKDTSTYSVVYQSYVHGIGWLKASADGQENLYAHNKPISAFRINLVPKSEKQYLINYWNRDVGTNHVN